MTIKNYPLSSQGLCESTLTERFINPDCICPTYEGNLGPCKEFTEGKNGRCLWCDHERHCHRVPRMNEVPATDLVTQLHDANARGVAPPQNLEGSVWKQVALLNEIERLQAEVGIHRDLLEEFLCASSGFDMDDWLKRVQSKLEDGNPFNQEESDDHE